MPEEILVFAAKQVGSELVDFLHETGAPIKRVVVAGEEDRSTLERVKSWGIEAAIFSKTTHRELIEKAGRFGWLLNLWSPHILRPELLALADKRLNTHPSLVPVCQGNDNAAWAIRDGLPAGVSLLEMEKRVDTGGVYAQREVLYSFPQTGRGLHQQLEKELIGLFKDSWPAIYAGEVQAQPQTGQGTRHTRKQTNEDRVQDLNTEMSLEEFLRWITAHDFSPGTTAEVRVGEKSYKLTLTAEESTGE